MQVTKITPTAKITPGMLRLKIEDVGLQFSQIYPVLGFSRAWFYRMIMENPEYSFNNPNPDRMQLIWDYCNAYEAFMESWRQK